MRLEALPAQIQSGIGGTVAMLPQPAFETDAGGDHPALNTAWMKLVGSSSQAQNRADWFDALHPDDRDAGCVFMANARGCDQPFTFELRLYDSARLAHRWHLLSAHPLRDDSGTCTGWCVVATDIHESRAAADAMRQSEANLRRIIEHEPACVKIISPGGILQEMNPAGLAMIGAPDRANVVGRDVIKLIHPEDRDIFLDLHRQALHGASAEAAFRLIGLTGEERSVESYAAPLTDAEGRVEAVVSVTRDVTERRRQADLRALGNSVLDAVSAGEPLNSVLEMIAVSVDRMNPATIASVLLVEDNRLRHGAAPGLSDAYNAAVDGAEVKDGVGTCGTAAARRSQVITTDIGTDPLWEGLAEIAKAHGLAACWSTPVLGPDGDVLATFGIYSAVARGPRPHEEALIAEVSQYVRIAIERTRQAEHLRRSEAQYRSIYDMVPVLIWEEDWRDVIPMIEALEDRGITDLAAHFESYPDDLTAAIKAVRVLSVNRTGARMFGAETGEELIAAFDDVVESPGARRIFTKSLVAWAAGERELEAESVNFDLQGRALHLLVKVALPDRAGGDTRLVLSEMDITAKRLADERFRIIAQATSDVVLDRDLIQDRIWCSDGMSGRFGHDPAALMAGEINYSDLIHPIDRPRIDDARDEALSDKADNWTAEYRLRCSDGHYADVRERSIILRDEDGRALRMIGSLVDITDQLRIEEQLRQSQRLDAIGQLTGGVAHDFNNLLTVILGNTEILAESLQDETLRKLAEMCAAAALRGAELTSRLLAFARKQSLDPKRVDVAALVRGLEGLLRRALGEQVEIILASAEPVWPATADAAQLESAILNLCLNARDAMPRGGRLTITMENVELRDPIPDLTAGSYVVIEVADIGIGMDAATLARAVEPFFTTKEVGKGSGLGLSMVYGFAKQSSGHVAITSELGVGTTVRLYLPRSDELPEIGDTPSDEHCAPGGSEAILLVEDDDLVRAHVKAQLLGLGYRVTSVATGHEALAMLNGIERFDLLFTDVVMPGGMSGTELAEKARTVFPGMPVLFTSGYSEDQIGGEGSLRPGQPVLRKPYRRQDLANHVRQSLDSAVTRGD